MKNTNSRGTQRSSVGSTNCLSLSRRKKIPILKIIYVLVIFTDILFIIVSDVPTVSVFGLQIGTSFYDVILLFLLYILALRELLVRRMVIQRTVILDGFVKIVLLWWCIVFFSTIVTPLINGGFAPSYGYSIKCMLKWTSEILFLLVGLKFFHFEKRELKVYINLLIILMVIIALLLLFKHKVFYNERILSLNHWKAYILWNNTQKNEYPEMFAFVAILSVSLGIYEKYTVRKILYIISAIILILAILPFFSRETYITLLVGTTILVAISETRPYIKISYFGILIAAILAFLKTNFGKYLLWTVENLSQNPVHATAGRVDRWIDAIRIGSHYPLTGVGFWGFNFFSTYGGQSAHNAYLQAFVVSGIPGIIIFSFVLYKIYKILRSDVLLSKGFTNACSKGLLSVFIGYLISGLFSDHFFTFHGYNILFWGTFAMITTTALNNIRNNIETNPFSTKGGFKK